MKIIYIPIVVPVNLRTFCALVLCLIGSIMLIVGLATEHWLVMEMRTDTPSPDTKVSKIIAYQSLQYVDVYVCSISTHFKGDFCIPTHVVYTQCDDVSDSWCIGRKGFLTALTFGVLSGIVGLLSIVVGLVMEMRHGYVAGAAGLLGVCGSIAYVVGYNDAVSGGFLPALLANAQANNGVVSHSLGFSFYCYVLGTCLVATGAAVSLSLRICPAHGVHNRALQAPKIQTVEMNARSSTQIATVAPQPGFVQLNDGRYTVDDDDDDDDGLITVPPRSPPKPLEAMSQSPMTRQDTQPPSLQQSVQDPPPASLQPGPRSSEEET